MICCLCCDECQVQTRCSGAGGSRQVFQASRSLLYLAGSHSVPKDFKSPFEHLLAFWQSPSVQVRRHPRGCASICVPLPGSLLHLPSWHHHTLKIACTLSQ